MSNNIEHIDTDEIVCPHCGNNHCTVDNEADGNYGGDMKCDGCGETFHFEADFVITWYTNKIEPEPQ